MLSRGDETVVLKNAGLARRRRSREALGRAFTACGCGIIGIIFVVCVDGMVIMSMHVNNVILEAFVIHNRAPAGKVISS